MWLWTGTVQALLAKGFMVVTMDCRGRGLLRISTRSTLNAYEGQGEILVPSYTRGSVPATLFLDVK